MPDSTTALSPLMFTARVSNDDQAINELSSDELDRARFRHAFLHAFVAGRNPTTIIDALIACHDAETAFADWQGRHPATGRANASLGMDDSLLALTDRAQMNET